MRTGLVLSGVLAAVMAFAGAAHAQLSSEGGPIQVEADNGEVLYRERKAIYSGNVDVIQGDARLRSDRIEVNYAGGGGSGGLGGGFGELTTIVATGDVFYVTPEFKARGDKGTYDARSGTITFEGKVVVSRGEDVASGDRLVLELGTGRSVLSAQDSGRVLTTLSPAQSGGGTPQP